MKNLPPNELSNALTAKINDRNATIGILGLGYVGLPLALRFSDEFKTVYGIDVDVTKTQKINTCETYIKQISSSRIKKAVQNGLVATSDYSVVSQCDVLIICVPTPLTKHREPDLSFVRITTEEILNYLKPGQLLSLESTTFPGTTEELIAPRLEKVGLNIGEDFFLVYSPEREDPGNEKFSTQSIPKIVGGYSSICCDVGVHTYASIVNKVVPVSSLKAAEMTKLLENIHRAVNIGLVNEMKTVTDKMGIDIYEVIDAAATKPFGFTPYYPGPGLGGHCIPIDPFYLTWKAREYGLHTRFIELAGEINASMPTWVVSKTISALNKVGKAIQGSHILVLGIAYKKNVDDVRESPSVIIMEQFRDMGAKVDYSDPHVLEFPKMREHQFELQSIQLTEETISTYDAVILATDHDLFDLQYIQANANLIIDTRGKFPINSQNILRA